MLKFVYKRSIWVIKRLLRVLYLPTSMLKGIVQVRFEKDESRILELYKDWCRAILRNFNIEVKVLGEAIPNNQVFIFVGNHISYFDIPIIGSLTGTRFVAKKEVSKWPIIGSACKSIGIIFVDRNNPNTRGQAGEKIKKAVLSEKKSITVFPSGTTSITQEKEWKKTIFKIAQEHQIPVINFRISYQPLREAAFIDDDALVPHLWNITKLDRIEAKIEFASPKIIDNYEMDCQSMENWSSRQGDA